MARAASYESWSEISEEEIDELSRIIPKPSSTGSPGYGSYIGWRTGIDYDGNWLYFVAGD